MGKRYYCDYCDKTMSSAPSIVKTHNNGLMHQRSLQEHYQKFKDPETILSEESKKKPCTKFPRGECQYGSVCRFSHYSPEAIHTLQQYVSSKQLANTITNLPSFQELYDKLQSEKMAETKDTVLIDDNGVTHKLPWSYNNALEEYVLPPSVQRITLEDFNNVSLCGWG